MEGLWDRSVESQVGPKLPHRPPCPERTGSASRLWLAVAQVFALFSNYVSLIKPLRFYDLHFMYSDDLTCLILVW